MVRNYDLKNTLLGFAFDLEKQSTSVSTAEDTLVWAKRRLTRINREYELFRKFNSKEYQKEHKGGKHE